MVQKCEVSTCKVQAVWWIGKTFPVKPGVALSHGLFGVRIVVGKDCFLCEQVRVFPLDGFFHVQQFVQ